MLSIKFHFPEEEDIHEYSLGHMDISAEENLLSSSGKSQRLMMVFVSIVDLSDGIIHLLSDKSCKDYEFIGTGSSFNLRISRNGNKVSIKNNEQQITIATDSEELVKALWQCWQDTEKLAGGIDQDSSAYLHMAEGKVRFQEVFVKII
jgi:hypothetical protein